MPHAVVYRMPNCPSGIKAVQLLNQHKISYTDHILADAQAVDQFKAEYQVQTTPQIFWDHQLIGGYENLRQHLQLDYEPAYSYNPVIAVFGTAGLVTLATSLGITGFMGFSLAMLASLKLMDIESFAESYAKYDLITQKFKPYARFYPFTELAIALGFLSGIASGLVGISSLLIGLVGGASVIKSVYLDKKKLNCACIGGNTKAPLGIISLSENLIMAIMGAVIATGSITNSVATAITPVPKPASQVEHLSHGDMDLGPADANYDLRFIDAMILHHQGALNMAQSALQNTRRPEIKQLAEAIISVQRQEIQQMQVWRKKWYPQAPNYPLAWHKSMNHMMAMSPTQIQMMTMEVGLGSADPNFDLRFLNAMIPHHEGAIAMAHDLSQKTKRPELQRLALAILTSQQEEIKQMKQWRQLWYLSYSS